MSTFYIKEDDTVPILQATLKNPDGSNVDLNGSEVDIRVTEARGGSNIVNDSVLVYNPSDGAIRYDFSNTDTSNCGRYRVEFEVTYGGGSVETYPNKGYHTLMIGRNMEK